MCGVCVACVCVLGVGVIRWCDVGGCGRWVQIRRVEDRRRGKGWCEEEGQ